MILTAVASKARSSTRAYPHCISSQVARMISSYIYCIRRVRKRILISSWRTVLPLAQEETSEVLTLDVATLNGSVKSKRKRVLNGISLCNYHKFIRCVKLSQERNWFNAETERKITNLTEKSTLNCSQPSNNRYARNEFKYETVHFATQWHNVLHTTGIINTGYLTTQHWQVGLYNGHGLSSLWGRNWHFMM
jgi:hypothetical protein